MPEMRGQVGEGWKRIRIKSRTKCSNFYDVEK